MNDAVKDPLVLVGPATFSNDFPELREDEIQVWIGHLRSAWTQRLETEVLLPKSERASLSKDTIEPKRASRLLARRLVRMLIGHILEIEPHTVRFSSHAHGKPRIDPQWNQTPVHFNVSHCDQGIAVALSLHQPIGVDIEPADRSVNHKALAHRYFPDADLRAYQQVPLLDRQLQFLKTWTQLEAAIKAQGGGLNLLFKRRPPGVTEWPRFPIPTPEDLIAAVSVQTPAPTHIRVFHL